MSDPDDNLTYRELLRTNKLLSDLLVAVRGLWWLFVGAMFGLGFYLQKHH